MAVAMIGPKFYAWDKNGKPLAFGKLYTYQARTNTPKDTYQSEDQIVPNTNPVILNGEGYADVYLSGSYKMVLKDDKNNEIWSSDPVSESQPDEWVKCLTASYASSTSFKVNGNFTSDYEPGRRVRIDNGITEYSYSTIISSSFASGETTVVISDTVVTTGVQEVCVSIVGPESQSGVGVFSFSDMESAKNARNLKVGYSFEIKERISGFGGGGAWDVVDAQSVTTNEMDIVESDVDTGIAFVFRSFNGEVSLRQLGAKGDESTSADTILYKTTNISVSRWSKNQDVGPMIILASQKYKKLIVDVGNFYINGQILLDSVGFVIEGVNREQSILISGGIAFQNTSKNIKVLSVGFLGEVEKFTPPLPITAETSLENDPGYIWYLDADQLGYSFEAVSVYPSTAVGVFAEDVTVGDCYFEMRQNCFLASSATEDRPDKTKDLVMTNCLTEAIWFWGFGGRYCSKVIVTDNIFNNHYSGGACDSSSGCDKVLFDGNIVNKFSQAFKSETRNTDPSVNIQSMFTNNIMVSADDNEPHAINGNGLSRVTGRGTKVSGNSYINTNANGNYFMQISAIYNDISDNLFINAGTGKTVGVFEVFVDVFTQQTISVARIYNNRYIKAPAATGDVIEAFVDLTERQEGLPSNFGELIVSGNTVEECNDFVRGNNTSVALETLPKCTIKDNQVDWCKRIFGGTFTINELSVINNQCRMVADGVAANSNAYVDIKVSRVTKSIDILNNVFTFNEAFTPSPSLPTKLFEVGGGTVDCSGAKVRIANNIAEISQLFAWIMPTNAAQYPAEAYIIGNTVTQRSTTTFPQQINMQNRVGGSMAALVKDNCINALADDFFIYIDDPVDGLQNAANNKTGLGSITSAFE